MDFQEIVPKCSSNSLFNWQGRKCFARFVDQRFCDYVHDMEVHTDDIWLVTPPKSGTTWMQELAWLVLNDFNFEGARSEHLEWRSPYLEYDYLLNKDLSRALKYVEGTKSPRLIKTHLPLPLLPRQIWEKKAKIIFVYRNPKDAWVSAYYHLLSVGRRVGETVNDFVKTLLDKLPKQSPFEDVTDFYRRRNEPWLFYTSFERMKANLNEIISDVCKFLNKSITDKQMEQMLRHLSFEEMKKNPTTNHIWETDQVIKKLQIKNAQPFNFVRKGKVNGYKDDLQIDIIERADNFIDSELAKYNVTLNELLLLIENEKNTN